MASRYEKIWKAIKTAGKQGVTIHCRPKKIPTIVLAVKQIKSAENRARIDLDLDRYGKLKIDREVTDKSKFGAKIRFELLSAELAENL